METVRGEEEGLWVKREEGEGKEKKEKGKKPRPPNFFPRY